LSSNRSSVRFEGAAPLPAELEDALAAARSRLGRIGSRVIYFPVIGSTNDVAAVLAARTDCEGAVVIADQQTAGRGRRGREWFSPAGGGLYVSVVLTPGRAGQHGSRATRMLTLAAGVALAEAIEVATGLWVDVKWPNDLYVAQRKLGGILAETAGGDASPQPIILGFGINVAPVRYPPGLRGRATSLESELGREVVRAALLVESMASLARRYDDLLEGRFDAILDAWRARAPSSLGARVTWTTAVGPEQGVTSGIDDEGALLVRVGERVERIIAGELTWL